MQILSNKVSEGENADNGSMDEARTKEYVAFIQNAWDKAVNHKDGETIPQEEFVLLKETNGTWHFTGTQQVRHIYKHHGNEKTEQARGQIAIRKQDFLHIPGIISDYAFILQDIRYQSKTAVLYAKHDIDGTYIYIEQISKRRRRKTTATFFKFAKQKDAGNLITILKNNHNYDVRNQKLPV